MNLTTVTITGADDSVRPQQLLEISAEYPFVEWGILFSERHFGQPRYPSVKWLLELDKLAHDVNPGVLKLSMHLCGSVVRGILTGELPNSVWAFCSMFDRYQLNFHAERNVCDPTKALMALLVLGMMGQRQTIFQIDGERGRAHLEAIRGAANAPVNMVGLFDSSGGNGVLPQQWPNPIYDVKGDFEPCGYAGGLGPDNLAEQLALIGVVSGDTPIWVDMETRVRSDDDSKLDLDKVRRCLEIAAPHVAHSTYIRSEEARMGGI